MIQINIGDHSGAEHNVPFLPIPERWRDELRWARLRAISVARHNPAADRYFRTLPRGRTLSSLVSDSSIWINYFNEPDVFGFTFTNTNLWMSDAAFRGGRWVVLATLVHELAHIAGAIGGVSVCSTWTTPCHAAEQAVMECGLGTRAEFKTGKDNPRTPYMPGIAG